MSAAVPVFGLQLREARFDDYKALVMLGASTGLESKPYHEWRRLWAGNPCYEEIGLSWPIGWVLEESGRIVGSLSNVPVSCTLRGLKLLAATARDWALEPPYRRYAPLLLEQYFNQSNVDVFLSHTVDEGAAEAFRQFGARPVPCGDWGSAAFAIVDYRSFADSALRAREIPLSGLLKYPAGLALGLKNRLTNGGIPQTDIEVTLASDFDQRFAGYWEILSQRSDTLMAVRTRDALKWHFAAARERGEIWVLTSARSGMIDAYAVFQRSDDPRSGLRRMRMADFQACDWQDHFCAAFMQRAYLECRRQDIHVLEHVGCGLEKTRIFDRSAPYRRQLPARSFSYFTPHPELAEELAQPACWSPSIFDGYYCL